MLCSDFGTSLASQAIASLSVTSFLPLGSLIGSSKRRDQFIADRARLGRGLWPVLRPLRRSTVRTESDGSKRRPSRNIVTASHLETGLRSCRTSAQPHCLISRTSAISHDSADRTASEAGTAWAAARPCAHHQDSRSCAFQSRNILNTNRLERSIVQFQIVVAPLPECP